MSRRTRQGPGACPCAPGSQGLALGAQGCANGRARGPRGTHQAPRGAPQAPMGAPQAPMGAPQASWAAPQAPWARPWQAPWARPWQAPWASPLHPVARHRTRQASGRAVTPSCAPGTLGPKVSPGAHHDARQGPWQHPCTLGHAPPPCTRLPWHVVAPAKSHPAPTAAHVFGAFLANEAAPGSHSPSPKGHVEPAQGTSGQRAWHPSASTMLS